METHLTQKEQRHILISQMNLQVNKYSLTFGFSVLTLNVADFSFMVDSFFQWQLKLVPACLGRKVASLAISKIRVPYLANRVSW